MDGTVSQYKVIPAQGCYALFYADEFCNPYIIANNVGGKTLLNLNREDLNDLFPGDFLSRKELWDLILSLVSTCLVKS